MHEDSDKGEDGDKDEDILSQLRQEMEKEKEQTLANKVKGESTGMEEKKDPTTDTADNNKPIEQLAAENVAKALALENAKLKAELSAFDKEFFDELEDMKLLLSETKPTKSSSSQQGQHTPLSPRTIGRLGRSAKVSLKAMTR